MTPTTGEREDAAPVKPRRVPGVLISLPMFLAFVGQPPPVTKKDE